MRIFNWMQNKLNGRHSSKKPDFSSSANHFVHKESCKEEFMEWPRGLLAIGTIGNVNFKNQDHDSQEPNPEELAKLQNEVNLLLREIDVAADSEAENDSISDDSDTKDAHLHRTTATVAFSRAGKDIGFDNTKSNNGVIRKKSFSFLLKKMIACRSGFAPAPSLKDPVYESRMEKIMRAILHKKMKIYPQSSSTTLSSKIYLKSRSVKNMPKYTDEVHEDDVNETQNGSKWVKTDSEYIVLEI